MYVFLRTETKISKFRGGRFLGLKMAADIIAAKAAFKIEPVGFLRRASPPRVDAFHTLGASL